MPTLHDPGTGVDALFTPPPTETTEEVASLRAELAEQVTASEPPIVDHAQDDVEIEIVIEHAEQAMHEIAHSLDELARARPHPPAVTRPWRRLAMSLAAGVAIGLVARGRS